VKIACSPLLHQLYQRYVMQPERVRSYIAAKASCVFA
jgi:hypothetical protein